MKLLAWLDQRPAFQCAGISIVLNLTLEILSRHSILAGFGFMLSEPVVFLYNAVIIMLTLSVAPALKRRYFALVVISVIWIALGVANCMLLFYRTTPLAASDLSTLVDSVAMQLTSAEIFLAIVAALYVFTGIKFIWIKLPMKKPKNMEAIACLSLAVILITSLTPFLFKTETLSSDFGSLTEAYNDYGFVYCFSCSLVDRGIDAPAGYSKESIAQLLKAIGADEIPMPNNRPNIIMVQLESFFDVNYLKGLDYSKNPVPIFTALKEGYPHGFLTVPIYGIGTANTEFEVLTGMNLDYFGAGEYPYKTVLQGNTCESICFTLAELGYTNHAIHNNVGTFYTRHIVFSNLGFNTFTPLEYISGVEYNPIGWAKDKILTGQIISALDSTGGQDFVYAISVQPHGKYPDETIDKTQRITVSNRGGIKEQAAYEYYINQLRETDAFIGDLVNKLSGYEEPIVMVLFGDHLPNLNILNADLRNHDRFQTEYVLWSNYPLEADNRDLSAYQLSAHVLKHIGVSTGIMPKFHQTMDNHENYQAALELLEYDMLFGGQYVYGDGGPPVPTKMQMGISDIIIKDIVVEQDVAFVVGSGFTEWSQVLIDGKKVATVFVDGSTLKVPRQAVKPGAGVVVAQIFDSRVHSKTNSFVCP